VGSVLIACLKQMWVEALILTAIGGGFGGLIHRFGGKAAARRVGQLEQERQQQAAKERERQDHLAGLVGREGVAVTDLKACGSASLEGEIVEVRALDGFIPKGTPVVVKSIQGKTPVVELRQPTDAIADRPGEDD
jgi:membrane-bound ClpP family serine protease